MRRHWNESTADAVPRIARWGFAATVVIAALAAACVGLTVEIPADIPGVALQAAALYRLEVGMAFFTGLYVVGMAIALAECLVGVGR